MKAITTNSFHAWVLAARPKTLTGAIIPVLIGSALAFADGKSDLIPALLCELFACGIQIAANFINDLYDYLKGSDRTDRLGPERACAQGWITPIAMKRGIMLRQCWGQLPHGGWELILLGLLCVIFAFLYTTVLSYRGWGDLLVLVFFGFIPVGGTYYVQAHAITADVWIASLICGLVIDTLLVVNNYRDREQTHAGCPLRRALRALPVPRIGRIGRLAQPMVCTCRQDRTACLHLGPLRLPVLARADVAQNGSHTERPKTKQHIR